MKVSVGAVLLLLAVTCGYVTAREGHVIVVSMPGTWQPYYEEYWGYIKTFIQDMEAAVADTEDELAIIYSDSAESLFDFNKTTAHKCKMPNHATGLDLWMRDFTTVVPGRDVQFKYEPRYLPEAGKKLAHDGMKNLYKNLLGVFPPNISDLIVDGGNVVDNGIDGKENGGRAILTKRVLAENTGYDEETIVETIEELIKREVFLVEDPGDTTGHADGMLSIVGNKLIIGECDTGEDSAAEAIKAKWDDMEIVPVHCPGGDQKGAKGFTTAVGWYTNSLVTDYAIYYPKFGNKAKDDAVAKVYEEVAKKKKVPTATLR